MPVLLRTLLALLCVTAVAAVAACSGRPAVRPGPTASPAVSIGGDRPVRVDVPPSYRPGTPVPLLVLLHGYGGAAEREESYLRLGPVAEAEGMLYARPEGTTDSRGRRFWNATPACCDLDRTGVDDSAYLRRVLDEIRSRWTVDPARIFVVGMSNGGFMAHRLACEHADLVTGIVSVAGAGAQNATDCRPSRPVSVLEIHGDADVTVRYDGRAGESGHPGAVRTVEDWAGRNGCAVPGRPGTARDLITGTGDGGSGGSPDGPESRVVTYAEGCRSGGHAELWTIVGGGHVPVLAPGFGRQVVDFLQAHPRAAG